MGTILPEAAFGRLVECIGPYRDNVVIIGGWASQLYDFHPLAAPQPDPPLMTLDADVYLEERPLSHMPKLNSRLAAYGFQEELAGSENPPVAKYHLPEAKGFFVEFLTDTTRRAPGSERDVTAGIEGVTAQKLDYLQLAMFQPWQVGPLSDPRFQWPAGAVVQIVNPTSYIVQKILTHGRRQLNKRGKDVLYIYDTLIRFADRLPELREIWQAIQTPQITPGEHVPTRFLSETAVGQLQRSARSMVDRVRDTHTSAANLAKQAGRSAQPQPEDIRQVLEYGLGAIFQA